MSATTNLSLTEKADSLIEAGKTLVRSGSELNKAQILFDEAITISKKLKDQDIEYEANLGIAGIQYKSGDYQSSFDFADSILQTIPIAEEKLIANYHKLIGNNLVYLGNYSKAYGHQLKALEYYQKIEDNKNLANMHFAIGNNFFYQSQFDLALEQFESALEIWKKEEDSKGIFWAVGAIGSVYEHQSKLKEAIQFSQEALSMAYEMDSKPDIAWTLYNLGSISTSNGEIEKGTNYIKEAHKIATELRDYPLIGYTLEGFTKIHIYTKEFDKALRFLDQSYSIAKENNELATMPNIYHYYAEIYYQQNNIQGYKKYTDKFIALKDSLNNEELSKAMGSLKKDFEVSELERKKEIALLKKDAKIDSFKKLIWMGSFSFAAFILILISIFASKNNRLQKEKNQLLLSSNQKILEQVEQLKSSNRDLKEYANIISHDLKEPLRNIGSFTTLLKRKLGVESVETCKQYMEYIFTGVNQMQQLLEDLKSYSIIETTSHVSDKKINTNDISNDIVNRMKAKYSEKDVKISSADLPDVFMSRNHFSAILNNLIDNGIKFNTSELPTIRIDCQRTQTDHIFAVHDNGIGIDPEYKEKIFVVFQRLNNRQDFHGSGIGLSSCKKILNLYSGKIWMESNPGTGSTFYFSIPIISHLTKVRKETEAVLA